MDINIIQQIEDCSQVLQKIQNQKLQNINLFGHSLDYFKQYKVSVGLIRPRDILEIKGLRSPMLIAKVILELYRILTQKNLCVPKVQKLQYKFENQSLECDILETTSREEQKGETLHPNFLFELQNLSALAINDETLEQLEVYNHLKKDILTLNYSKRVSIFISQLLDCILNIQSFCDQIKPIKQSINLYYPPISKQINKIQNMLINKEVELVVQQQVSNFDQKSNVEIAFEEILKKLPNDFEIIKYESSFIHYFRINFDLKEWIKNKRPLNYWSTIDHETESQKLNELANIYTFNQNDIHQLELSFGYDFLMLLKESELQKIQKLEIKISGTPEMEKFLEKSYPIKQLKLKSLFLQNSFANFIFQNQKAYTLIFDLIKASQNLQEFSIQLYNSNQFSLLSKLVEAVVNYETLNRLDLDFIYSDMTYEQSLSILNLTYSAKNLKQFQIRLPSKDEKLNLNMFDGLKNLQQLDSLNLTFICGSNNEIFYQLTTVLPKLQNLTTFSLTIHRIEQEDIGLLKELRKVLQKKRIYCMSIDFDWSNNFYEKYEARSLFKLKYAVQLNIYPCINDMFQVNQEEYEQDYEYE